MKRILTAILGLAALTSCGQAALEQACWLERVDTLGGCQDDYMGCVQAADSADQQVGCADSYASCVAFAEGDLADCAGEGGCLEAYGDCAAACESSCAGAADTNCQAHCITACQGDLETCADWWQIDCEESCADELGYCVEHATEIVSDEDDLHATLWGCYRSYYQACVPGCYEE